MKTPKKKPGSPLDKLYRRTDLTAEQIFQALCRLRQEAQDQIEFLIDLVNEMDGDADLEPSLGDGDDREEECEDEGAQCEDEGVMCSGIGDFDGLMEQCPGYSGSGASGFARFVA